MVEGLAKQRGETALWRMPLNLRADSRRHLNSLAKRRKGSAQPLQGDLLEPSCRRGRRTVGKHLSRAIYTPPYPTYFGIVVRCTSHALHRSHRIALAAE